MIEHDMLSFAQVVHLMGVTRRQLDYLVRQSDLPLLRLGEWRGHPRMWPPHTVRRLQVAAALAAGPDDPRPGHNLAKILPKVVAGPEPEPTRLAAITDQGVFYVNYLSDLETQINEWALCVVMPRLWPDVDPELYAEVQEVNKRATAKAGLGGLTVEQ